MINDDLSGDAKRMQERLLANPKLSAENKHYLEEYFVHLRAMRRDPSTIIKHVEGLTALLEGLNYKADLKKATIKDVERAAAYINDLKTKKGVRVAESTRNRWIVIWKYFYKDLLGNGEYYPECVRWLKQTFNEQNKLLPEYLLTEEEVMSLIDAAQNLRDKAFISLLYETGARIGEILDLRKRYIDLNSNPAVVYFSGKTGMRPVPIMISVSHLANYLNIIKPVKDNVPIWMEIGHNSIYKNEFIPMEYDTIRRQIAKIAEKVGINKKVNPHSFRKSRATHLANKLTDQQLKAFFGWVPSSGMAEVYVHLSGRDINDAYQRIYGIIPKDKKEMLQKVRICSRCQYSNNTETVYCGRCGNPLTVEEGVRAAKAKAWADKQVAEMLNNPQKIDEMIEKRVKKILAARKKKANDSG
ncbi:tyrosine-type recombinase/integrase [Candidatus Marsarchaeota archaeon]|nr:tyrosine-type recombinase/integrase [Candidatus Marsarchaeota archaeon]MCL5115439.1 tyrosine-type recombinase/integrase [Candidatus Marsarchaeota archaeon]